MAHQTNCRRLVLLKDVDGLWGLGTEESSPDQLIAELDVEQLAGHIGGVDEYLSQFLVSAPVEAWIINGLRPERLSELLNTGHTTGTLITPQRY